jgi:hypothetical protein
LCVHLLLCFAYVSAFVISVCCLVLGFAYVGAAVLPVGFLHVYYLVHTAIAVVNLAPW